MNMHGQEASWLARLREGPLTADEARAFEHWLAQGDNRAAFEHARALVDDALSDIADDPQIVEMRAAALAGLRPGVARRRRGPARPMVAAAAAVVVVAAVSAAAVVAPSAGARFRIQTAVGQTSTVGLPDGSTAEVNTDSVLEVAYTPLRRTVRLVKGEAHFTVRHGLLRPFTVAAGDLDVRDVGTAFDVLRLDEASSVTVSQGAVDVAVRGGPPRRLVQGDKLTLARDAVGARFARAELGRDLAWRSGRIDLEDAPLDAAVAELARYSRVRIVLADPAMGRARISGVYDPRDPTTFARGVAAVEGWRAVIADPLQIRLEP
ncbi:hypothetical protein C5708_09145 [Caulobacter sp. CCUG 60055]|uniref:FecR family protein n=1 Tax=Caulobacter sp. CCUG 60055 TaxID=2100090 RepID=UPI00325BB2E9|nr:hypothetical protein [Caulobacter sp. CCUG 60055]